MILNKEAPAQKILSGGIPEAGITLITVRAGNFTILMKDIETTCVAGPTTLAEAPDISGENSEGCGIQALVALAVSIR